MSLHYQEGYAAGRKWPKSWRSHGKPGGPYVPRRGADRERKLQENADWRKGWQDGFDKLMKREKNKMKVDGYTFKVKSAAEIDFIRLCEENKDAKAFLVILERGAALFLSENLRNNYCGPFHYDQMKPSRGYSCLGFVAGEEKLVAPGETKLPFGFRVILITMAEIDKVLLQIKSLTPKTEKVHKVRVKRIL